MVLAALAETHRGQLRHPAGAMPEREQLESRDAEFTPHRSTLSLGGPTPDAARLGISQGRTETFRLDWAACTNRFRRFRRLTARWEVVIAPGPATCRVCPPRRPSEEVRERTEQFADVIRREAWEDIRERHKGKVTTVSFASLTRDAGSARAIGVQ